MTTTPTVDLTVLPPASDLARAYQLEWERMPERLFHQWLGASDPTVLRAVLTAAHQNRALMSDTLYRIIFRSLENRTR